MNTKKLKFSYFTIENIYKYIKENVNKMNIFSSTKDCIILESLSYRLKIKNFGYHITVSLYEVFNEEESFYKEEVDTNVKGVHKAIKNAINKFAEILENDVYLSYRYAYERLLLHIKKEITANTKFHTEFYNDTRLNIKLHRYFFDIYAEADIIYIEILENDDRFNLDLQLNTYSFSNILELLKFIKELEYKIVNNENN